MLVGISAWISTPSQRFDCGPLVNICNRYHFISPADQSSCSCLVIVLSTNSLSYASSMHLSFRCSLLNRTERSSRFAWFLSYLSSSWQRKGGRKGGHGMRVERCRTVSNSDWPPSHIISFESFFFNSFQRFSITLRWCFMLNKYFYRMFLCYTFYLKITLFLPMARRSKILSMVYNNRPLT